MLNYYDIVGFFFYHVRNKDALHYQHVVMTYKYETRMSFREHNCNYICINYMYSIQVQTLKTRFVCTYFLSSNKDDIIAYYHLRKFFILP